MDGCEWQGYPLTLFIVNSLHEPSWTGSFPLFIWFLFSIFNTTKGEGSPLPEEEEDVGWLVLRKGGCGPWGLERQNPGEVGEPDVRGEHHAVYKGASHVSPTAT